MDPTIQPPRTPNWAPLQKTLFLKNQSGEHALFDTHPDELEKLAKQTLSKGGWLYASCNAGVGWTHRANREAFFRQRIIPRMLQDTTARDTTTELFGHRIGAPILFAPVGINKIYHPLGELNAAKVAGELNLPYCLSTAGSQSIEDVAAANDLGATQPDPAYLKPRPEYLGVHTQALDQQLIAQQGEAEGFTHGKGIRFFQLYAPHDEALLESLMRRAVDNGFTACILTVDTWQLAWRHHDIANANYAFYRGIGAEMGLSDPVFRKKIEAYGLNPNKAEDMPKIGELWIDQVWNGRAHSWAGMPSMIEKWKKISNGAPFLIKGIQSVADAQQAVKVGCDGIVVSNHAGRQVDGAVGSLDVLPDIVDAVGDKLTILFDSGIRSGADVFKALALGAKAVLVGRLYVYGMGIAGEAGVRHVMRSLLAEFDILMNVAGFNKVSDIDRTALKFIPYGTPTEATDMASSV